MKKCLLIHLVMLATVQVIAQTDSFDVFTFQHPEFFTKSKFSLALNLKMTNKDGSFCTITLHKSQSAKKMS